MLTNVNLLLANLMLFLGALGALPEDRGRWVELTENAARLHARGVEFPHTQTRRSFSGQLIFLFGMSNARI